MKAFGAFAWGLSVQTSAGSGTYEGRPLVSLFTPGACTRAMQRYGPRPAQIGSATRSWPSVPTMRARVNSPTLSCLLTFSGGKRRTRPSISGASA